jgi:DNA-binding MarR family transcriptional regulator
MLYAIVVSDNNRPQDVFAGSVRPERAMGAALKRRQADDNAVGRKMARAFVSSSSVQSEMLELGELNGHLGYFLRRLQIAVFKDFIRTLAPMRLRPAQYSVLVLIGINPGRSQAAIGQALNIERARLARLLHELERRKWIERRASDGRSHSLFLTSEGDKVLVRIKGLAKRHEAQIAAFVGPNRRMVLMDLLKDFG